MAEPLRALEAEAEAPEEVGYRLVTQVGEAVLTVPRPNQWRASARRVLVDPNRMDADIEWARIVLSAEDFAEWMRCDPTPEEAGIFLAKVFAGNGESLGNSVSSTSSSRSTRKK